MGEKRSQAQLQKDFRDLKKHPVEGFTVNLIDDDIYKWEIYIIGPPDTNYEGGAFRSVLTFPTDYPYTPPKLVFTSDIWHPNVYFGGRKSGEVCISILHPPGGNPDMPDECESDAERWNPLHSVSTIILSVISMLSDPNFSSPANIDASVQLRKDVEGFKKRVKEAVQKSLREIPQDFEWPTTKSAPPPRELTLSECDAPMDDDIEDQDDPLVAQFVGMGFERSQIEDAINELKRLGKKK